MSRPRRWLDATLAALRADPLRLVLGAGAVVLAIWLWESEKPWDGHGAQRLADGRRLAVVHHVEMATWWAAAVNLLLLALLAGTRPWWRRWTAAEAEHQRTGAWPQERWQRRAVPGWSIAVLAVVVVFAAVYRGRLLDREIQRDEQDNLRRNIFGHYEPQPDGSLEFFAVTWRASFFENRLANNPILFSVLSHASLSVWQEASGAGPERFSLVAVRLPAFIAGIASLVAVWWVLNVFGFIRAAPVAAALLALHPYHADYTLQARGYSLVMLFVLLAAGCLMRALNSGRWRWWWGFGFSLMGMLYAYAGAIYAVVAFAAAALVAVAVLLRGERRVSGRAQLCRLAVCGIVVGGIYLQLVAPSVPQVRAHLGDNFEKISLHAEWYVLAYQNYFGGVRFLRSSIPEAVDKTAFEYLTDHVLPENRSLAILLVIALPLLAVFGLARAWRRNTLAGGLLTAGLLAPALSWAHHNFVTGLYLYDWYWIYALPFLFMLIAIGATAWWSREDAAEVREAAVFGRDRRLSARRIGSICCVILLLSWFWWETRPGRYGRRMMTLDVKGEQVVFPRGDYDWIVTRDGRMIREPRAAPDQ